MTAHSYIEWCYQNDIFVELIEILIFNWQSRTPALIFEYINNTDFKVTFLFALQTLYFESYS